MTKTEFTNEQIAEALGWKRNPIYLDWHCGGQVFGATPNFRKDSNACFKHVWPRLTDPMLMETSTSIVISRRVDGTMTKWTPGDSPSDAICQAFMEKGKLNDR